MGGLLEEVGNLTEIEAATAAVALLRALAAQHKAGVAHRDLKLDNLLLALTVLSAERPSAEKALARPWLAAADSEVNKTMDFAAFW
eukprot:jgi/Tetstr1/425917/TSEL_001593.t1